MSTRLSLITSEIRDGGAILPVLERTLGAAPFAAVVLRIVAADEHGYVRLAKPLVEAVQKAGAAAVLHAPSDTRLVGRTGADSAQYPIGHAQAKDVLGALKPDRIVGFCGIRTRHEAMEAGESDCDYVLFGEPRADGSVPEAEKTLGRAQWWAEIFTVPGVAYADRHEDIAPLAGTGIDFIALGGWVLSAADPAEAARAALAALSR